MSIESDILKAMNEYIRKALSEAAKEEIDKLKHRFECEMGKVKREMIGKIIDNIDIVTSHDSKCIGYTVQVNINKPIINEGD